MIAQVVTSVNEEGADDKPDFHTNNLSFDWQEKEKNKLITIQFEF